MAKEIINNGETGLVVRGKLNANFTELYDKDVNLESQLADKSDTGHNHDGVYEPADPAIQAHITSPHNYEPADANIQAHITSPHAPSDANNYIHPATHPLSMISGVGTAASMNAGTGAGEVLKIDTDGKLPVIDGSKLSNINPLTEDQENAIDASNNPSTVNPFATKNDLPVGDMKKTVYDPNNISSDAFDMGNMTESTTAKILTADERTAIATNSDKDGITPEQATVIDDAELHMADTDNPHGVTATQVGLGNVDNTSDVNKPISNDVATALAGKSDTSHTHDGVYEPADDAIQFHINSFHAPPDAQKNADITLAEIEAKLIGDDITSHTHKHLTQNASIGASGSQFARKNHTLTEATKNNDWESDGVVETLLTENRAAQVAITIDKERNVPIMKHRVSGLPPEEPIEDAFGGGEEGSYTRLDTTMWSETGSFSGVGMTSDGTDNYLRIAPTGTGSNRYFLLSNFFWTVGSDIDIEYEFYFESNTQYSFYSGLHWDTEDLVNTMPDYYDYGIRTNYNKDDLYGGIIASANSTYTFNIYNFALSTWRAVRFQRICNVDGSYKFTFYLWNGTDWSEIKTQDNITWKGDGALSDNMFFCMHTDYYNSSNYNKVRIRNFKDRLGTATYSADTAWTEWSGTADKLINYDEANITLSSSPESYPLGPSIVNISSSSDFPVNSGTLTTQKYNDTEATQVLLDLNTSDVYTRTYSNIVSDNEKYLSMDFVGGIHWPQHAMTRYFDSFIQFNSDRVFFTMVKDDFVSTPYNMIGQAVIAGVDDNWELEARIDISLFDKGTCNDRIFYVLGISKDTIQWVWNGTTYVRACCYIEGYNGYYLCFAKEYSSTTTRIEITSDVYYVKLVKSGTTLHWLYKTTEDSAWSSAGVVFADKYPGGCRYWFGWSHGLNYSAKEIPDGAQISYDYISLTNAHNPYRRKTAGWSDWKKTISYEEAENKNHIVYDGYDFLPAENESAELIEINATVSEGSTINIDHKSDAIYQRSLKIFEKVSPSTGLSFTNNDFSGAEKYIQHPNGYHLDSCVDFVSGTMTMHSGNYGFQEKLNAYVGELSTSADYSSSYGDSCYLSNDGLNFYMWDYRANSKCIGWWVLTTAFDFSTATFQGSSPALTCDNSYTISFSDDGKQLYYQNYYPMRIRQCSLSTAWDVTTLNTTYTESPIDIGYSSTGSHFDFSITSDGVYLICAQIYRYLYEYKMTTPWDISTLEYVAGMHSDDLPYDKIAARFSPDGKQVYLPSIYSGNSGINILELEEPFDISTYTGFTKNAWDSAPPSQRGGCITPDGRYIVVNGTDEYSRLYSMKMVGVYLRETPMIATTNSLSSFSTANVSIINSISFTATMPTDTGIYVFTSFDNRKTWNTYVSATSSFVPVTLTKTTMIAHGNTISEIETVFTSFAIDDDCTAIDFAFGLYTNDVNGTSTPELDQVTINYDEQDSYVLTFTGYDIIMGSDILTSIKKTSVGTEDVKIALTV